MFSENYPIFGIQILSLGVTWGKTHLGNTSKTQRDALTQRIPDVTHRVRCAPELFGSTHAFVQI